MPLIRYLLVVFCIGLVGCSEPEPATPKVPLPDFEARGDLAGFVITYVDEEGPHAVMSRDEVPEERRTQVRIKKLTDDNTPPNHVWVADLTKEGTKGYPVKAMSRDAFDKVIDVATGVELATNESAAEGEEGVIIYGADWCGACKSAAKYLESKGVPFVEKNIEKDEAARKEMQSKAKAAGVVPSGIPVIDAYGKILTGFDQRALERAVSANATGAKPNPTTTAPTAPPANVY